MRPRASSIPAEGPPVQAPDLPRLPIQPVQVQLPSRPTTSTAVTGTLTAVHYSDVHYPEQNESALSILYAVLEDLEPGLVVNHGDLLTCYKISSYAKNPDHEHDLQDEIEQAAKHLALVSSLTPGAQRILIQGNHEDRLKRQIWSISEKEAGKQILTLPGVRKALEWPSLLGLDALGWEWEPNKRVLYDKLVLKHGDVVRRWAGNSARGEWEKYGKSGMSGHVHRAGAFVHRDLSGSNGWWEIPCLCELNPEYMESPDWQNGFCVVTWSEDRERFAVETVYIQDGRAIFRGKEYRAT